MSAFQIWITLSISPKQPSGATVTPDWLAVISVQLIEGLIFYFSIDIVKCTCTSVTSQDVQSQAVNSVLHWCGMLASFGRTGEWVF